jgi:hypothetical protein
MRSHFAIWCIVRSCIVTLFLITSNLFAEDIVFTGKLVRKYYQHLIPQAVERGVFGWFLELDSSSKLSLQKKIAEMNEDDRQYLADLGFDLSIVQLFLSGAEDKELCRRFEGKEVEVLGEWPSFPHVFRPIPSYQLHLTEMKQISEDIVELSGILRFKAFPGPPNYNCIESGDYPEACWVLNLDKGSKDLLVEPMSLACDSKDDEIVIRLDKPFEELQQYANASVVCLGRIQHAETAHDHTPLLLHSCRISLNASNDASKNPLIDTIHNKEVFCN